MVLAAILLVAILLFIAAFVAPRLTRKPQSHADQKLEAAKQRTESAPGPLGKLLPGSAKLSKKTIDKSADAGREGRAKVD